MAALSGEQRIRRNRRLVSKLSRLAGVPLSVAAPKRFPRIRMGVKSETMF